MSIIVGSKKTSYVINPNTVPKCRWASEGHGVQLIDPGVSDLMDGFLEAASVV